MRKLGMRGYEKVTEEERRKKWSKKMSFVAVFSMIVFLGFLFAGAFISPGRQCAKRQALESAVCIDCVDKYCDDCSSNSKACVTCESGYVKNSDGRCEDCDLEPYKKCLSCSIANDGTKICN